MTGRSFYKVCSKLLAFQVVTVVWARWSLERFVASKGGLPKWSTWIVLGRPKPNTLRCCEVFGFAPALLFSWRDQLGEDMLDLIPDKLPVRSLGVELVEFQAVPAVFGVGLGLGQALGG